MHLPEFLTRDKHGEIRLTGHRIGLYTVVRCRQDGYSAQMIAEEYPTLPLELVERVLAFYRANQAEVDVYVAEVRLEIERQAAAPARGPDGEELRRRWQAMGRAELP